MRETTRSPELLLSTWAALESAGMRAAVLRNYAALPEHVEGDVDVLVHPEDLERTGSIIQAIARDAGWRVLFDETVSNHRQLVLWHPRKASGQGPERLHFDLQNALGNKGFRYGEAEPFLEDLDRFAGLSVPQPEARAVALALHTLLDKGTVRSAYREALLRDAVPGLESFARRALPGRAAGPLCEWIRAGAPEQRVAAVSRGLRRGLILADPLNLVRPQLVRLRRRLRYLGRRRGVLAALLGPDGAGKSTILSSVQEMTPPGPFPVRTVYMGKRDAFLPTSRLIRLVYRRRNELGGGPGRSRRSGLGLALYRLKDLAGMLNWIFEQWGRYLIQVRPVLQQGGVVLTDRYAYDFGNHDLGSLAHRAFFRALLLRLLPRPDRTYLLWETPEVLHARKGELTPADAAVRLELLRQVIRRVPCAREIQTRGPIEAIASDIAHEVAAVLESRYA